MVLSIFAFHSISFFKVHNSGVYFEKYIIDVENKEVYLNKQNL